IDGNSSTTLLAGTGNDGSQSFTATTRQLTTEGSTQVWYGEAVNIQPSDVIQGPNYTVIARYKAFYGDSASAPNNSATIRALARYSFISGSGNFTFSTGTTNNVFTISLPNGKSLVKVEDLGNLNADITDQFIHSNINVNDAGGTPYSSEVYIMTTGI